MIWNKKYSLDEVNQMGAGNMLEHLDILIEEIGEDFLEGTMPVDHRTKQPFGILHGGANCVLAESLGSLAANLTLDPIQSHAVGLNIATNHIKAVRNGRIKGIAKPTHLGKTTQIWGIKTYTESGLLTSDTRLTMMVLNKKL